MITPGPIASRLPRNELGIVLPAYDDEALVSLLDIRPGDRVLDVGGGSRPFRRADVVVDMYLHDNIHRGGTAAHAGGARLVEADVQDLPFEDGAFDVVICRHVLEHVADPARACKELSRVSRRGFIETPSSINELMHGYPNHLWLVTSDGSSLTFEPKRFARNPFSNITRYLHYADADFRAAFESSYRNVFCTQLYFEGDFHVEVMPRDEASFDYDDPAQAALAHFDYALNYLRYGLDAHVPDEVSEHLQRAAELAGEGSVPSSLARLFSMREGIDRAALLQVVDDARALLSKDRPLTELLGMTTATSGGAEADPRETEQDRVTVSVVVRTFNRARLLERCLDSLAKQTFRDFEVVVVNDAGGDVGEVVGSFASALDVRSVVHPYPRGRAGSLNSGLSAARGRFVCFVDDDDVVYANHLQALVDGMSDSGADVVYTLSLQAQEDSYGTVLERALVHARQHDREALLGSNYLPILSVLLPRDRILAMGGFDEELEVLEDWEFWIRLSSATRFELLPRITSEYRTRGDRSNTTASHRARWADAVRLIDRKHPVPDSSAAASARAAVLAGWSGATPAYQTSLAVVGQDVARAAQVISSGRDLAPDVHVVAVLPRCVVSEGLARDLADADVVLVPAAGYDPVAALEIARTRALGAEVVEVTVEDEPTHVLGGADRSFPATILVEVRAEPLEVVKATLVALSESTPPELYDAVVVERGASEEARDWLALLEGEVCLLDGRDDADGFASLQRAAHAGTGDVIVLTRLGIEWTPGWLERCLAHFAADPDAEAVIATRAEREVPHQVAPYDLPVDAVIAVRRHVLLDAGVDAPCREVTAFDAALVAAADRQWRVVRDTWGQEPATTGGGIPSSAGSGRRR